MPTPCTTPTAPFYHADLIILRFLESHGIDIPCDMLNAAIAGTFIGLLISLLTITFFLSFFANHFLQSVISSRKPK